MFPIPEEDFMRAITGELAQGPKQGGIPNRFKGVTAEVSTDFPANEVVRIVQAAWQHLAELVWQQDLVLYFSANPALNMQLCREVWERQITQIWEMSWALTEDPHVSNLLDRRKNWRSHYAAPEPGDKCMMMAGWQELSGEMKAGERRAFWEGLRKSIKGGKSDLEDGEQLCALAFIKRRFARYFDKFRVEPGVLVRQLGLGSEIKAPALSGWSFTRDKHELDDYDPTHVPSLPYLAAVPYIKAAYQAIAKRPDLACVYQQFTEKAESQLGLPSQYVDLPSLSEALNKTNLAPRVGAIDGISFYPGTLLASKNYAHLQTQDLVRRYQRFNKEAGLNPATPFYALLLMDGDALGTQMSDPAKQAGISQALNAFTKHVPAIVRAHDGFLVYAGGDDVLALMPMDTAIDCARALEQCYGECFKEARGNTNLHSTLSGAIQFSHYRTPLMKIVSEAHQLLNKVAKEQTGRHALAIRINKPGGVHAEWAWPWDVLYPQQQTNQLTNVVLFKLQELLSMVAQDVEQPELLHALARAEYFHSGEQLHIKKQELLQDLDHLDELLEICRCYQREQTSKTNYQIKLKRGLQLDGLKLVRFLATKGLEQREGM
jgi:CRISPR-associated protein Cmr2